MGRAALDYLPHYTLEDYDRWEGDWELIDGVPFAMAPSPKANHQALAGKLHLIVGRQLEDCRTCSIFYELDWRMAHDTVVRPDLLIVCGDEVLDYVRKAPVLIAEVESGASREYDRQLKFNLYQKHGVAYYLIASPVEGRLEAYVLEKGVYKLQKGDAFTFQLSKDCRIQLPETIDM